VSLDGDSEIARREIFDTLMRMTSSHVTLTIKLPADGNKEDRRRLLDLASVTYAISKAESSPSI
jgi:hypothetical protein